jgi:hypothetical protein
VIAKKRWKNPPQQVRKIKVFVSPEHEGLTPIFGTSCPPRGLSGLIRGYAYRFSEGQKLHWILLLAADRVDVVEGFFEGLVRLRPDNPFSEMGLASEFRRGGFRSRLDWRRGDTRRQAQQLMMIAGLGGFFVARAAIKRRKAA